MMCATGNQVARFLLRETGQQEDPHMFVRDIMTTRLELVNRRASLQDAAAKMAALGVGALPVVDRGQRLVGMITDRDITVRAVARGLAPDATSVEDVMTPGLIDCREDHDIEELARLMEHHELRRIVVCNANGKPVGIVSLDDIAWRGADKRLVAEALHRTLVSSN